MEKEHIKYDRKWMVYKHTSPSGKVYIGITSKEDPKDRWGPKGCMYKYNVLFWNAIQKYGWDNIEHEILYENLEEEDAKNKEIELIAEYKSIGMSYNITNGGDGCSYVMPQEQKVKISNALKGKKKTPEHARKVREAITGRDWLWMHKDGKDTRVETKNLERFKSEGWEEGRLYKPSKMHRERISKSCTGHAISDEMKHKLSEAGKGKLKGYVNMNDGVLNYRIPRDKVSDHLNEGWSIGWIGYHGAGMRWINKDGQELKIKYDELDTYLAAGWKKGRNVTNYKRDKRKLQEKQEENSYTNE